MQRYTVYQFNADFPNDDACLEFVAGLVWPGFPEIPCRSAKCGGTITKHHRLTNRKAYTCQACGTHVYPLAGTIFEKSTTPLKSWFYAMYLVSSTRMGISAKQLERELGVTYKTAWRMYQQIRLLLAEDNPGTFSGEIEMDETYVGGRPRNRGTGKRGKPGKDSTKTAVAGILERKSGGAGVGRVQAYVVPDTSSRTLDPLLQRKLLRPVTVFTDEAAVYRGLTKRTGYHHKRVNHSAGVWVRGNVHTNSIEGFWSMVKNGLRGVYRQVGSHKLQAYLNEYSFRYNHRRDERPMFESVTLRVSRTRAGKHGAYARLG